MRRILLTVLVLCAFGLSAIAQSRSVKGDKISLPDGDVIGAAFDDGDSTLIVQQSVISTENGGPVFRSHRLLTSWSVSHDYCSPSTGVHFAVGAILKRYVVGFTGTTKTHAFLERNTSFQSSFSIWRAENPKVEAIVSDPTDYGASQYEIRIAVSKTTAMFLTYASSSNALYLYSIKDIN